MNSTPTPSLILASSSRYRRELLSRLNLAFQCQSPNVDESPLSGETPEALARRLAKRKAAVIAAEHPDAWVIGSDQVLECGGQLYGKPMTRERAATQLAQLSGQSAQFHTALCLITPYKSLEAMDVTITKYRSLSKAEIQRYLDLESALDCAGSCKAEGLGIALCESIQSNDPTGLIGLPLIALRRLLAEAGWPLP